MARQSLALEILALYAVAAVSCGDDASGPTTPDAGSGGWDAGSRSPEAGSAPEAGARDSGTTQRPKTGDVCDAGEQVNDAFKSCAQARVDRLQTCRQRYEATQCYVVTDGSACLPAEDPKLVEHLVDHITSAGFTPEFVIADAPGGEVPASCDALLECCSQLPDTYLRVSCYDQLDDPERQPFCKDWSPSRLQPNVSCPAPDADAGAPSSERPRLCCYKTCGYTVAT